MKSTIVKTSADIPQFEIDEASTGEEYEVVDVATQSSVGDILPCITPKNGTGDKTMQPPAIKRKGNDSSSKLSSDTFQPVIKKAFPRSLPYRG